VRELSGVNIVSQPGALTTDGPLVVTNFAGRLPVFNTVYEIATESPGANGPTSKLTAPVEGRAGEIPLIWTQEGPLLIESAVISNVSVPALAVAFRVKSELKAA
jgi:hypothetical protein